MFTDEKLIKIPRKYYPENLKVHRWRTIKKEFLKLLSMPISCAQDLEYLIHKSGEGIKLIFDYRNRLFIKMKSKTTFFNFLNFILFQKNIISRGLKYNHSWENKINDSPFKDHLNSKEYGHLLKIIHHQQQFYQEKNNKLFSKEERLGNQYTIIISRLRDKFEGESLTMAETERRLMDMNQELRKKAFFKIAQNYQKINIKLQKLFNQLLKLRHTIAKNCGYQNYRDYTHHAKARFSYSIEDVLDFHEIIEKEVVPILQILNGKLAKSLQVEKLKPWDMKVEGPIRLRPYNNQADLIEKCTQTLLHIKPEYGIHFKKLVNTGLLDIFNRKRKSLGSYNIPTYENGGSFIFANFIEKLGTHQDIAILHHEFGHALHNYLTNDIPIMTYRNFPSEISELAAMTMELLTIDQLHFYYPDPVSQEEAKKQQLRRLLHLIVSRCQGDAYQHWIYTHPEHGEDERNKAYIQTSKRFDDGVCWIGAENYQHLESLKVLHFFQVPFYYIEYAFAALGALDIYRQYKINPNKTLERYENFLKEGYNKDVHLLYEQAGTTFKFSSEHVRNLMKFVQAEFQLSS